MSESSYKPDADQDPSTTSRLHPEADTPRPMSAVELDEQAERAAQMAHDGTDPSLVHNAQNNPHPR